MSEPEGGEVYIGDGVYVRFDGFHVWLRTPRGELVNAEIALEPAVIVELVRFIAGLREKFPGQAVPAWEALAAAVRAHQP